MDIGAVQGAYRPALARLTPQERTRLMRDVRAAHFLSADTLIAEVNVESQIIAGSNIQILQPQSNV